MADTSWDDLPAAMADDLEAGFFTVADLIEALQKYPPDTEVVLDSDAGELISLDEVWPTQAVRLPDSDIRLWAWGPEADKYTTTERPLKIRLG